VIDLDNVAAAACGLLIGWICRTALERRQSYWLDYHLRRRRRRRRSTNPPQQPLTADLIRYWRWQNMQVRHALEEDTNNPPRSPRD
jgi:hypothetical protein